MNSVIYIYNVISIILLIFIPILMIMIMKGRLETEKIILSIIISVTAIPITIFYFCITTGFVLTSKLIFCILLIISCILCLILYTKKKNIVPRLKKLNRKSLLLLVLSISILVLYASNANIPEGTRFDCADNWIYKNTETDTILQYCDPKLEGYENRLPKQILLSENSIEYQIEEAENNTFLELTSYCSYNNTGNILNNYKEIPITSDEPYSSAIHISFFYALLGDKGIKLFYGMMITGIFFLTFLITNKLTKKYYLSIIIGILVISLDLFSLGTIHNPNYIASLMMLLMVFFLIENKRRSLLYAGVAYGFLGAIRPITIIIAPIILLYLYSIHSRKTKQRTLQFIIGSVIGIIPTLIMNLVLYNNPLQFPGFLFFPEIEHKIFGISFFINTALNYPFFTELIRTPWYPYPMYVYLPLIITKNLGLLLFAAIPLGIMKIKNKHRILLGLTPLTFIFFLIVNENWMFEKTTLLNIVLPLIVILSGIGLYELTKNINITKTMAIFISTFVIVFISVNLMYGIDVPEDPRSLMINEDNFNFYRKNSVESQKDFIHVSILPDVNTNIFKHKEKNSKNWYEQISNGTINSPIMQFNIVKYKGGNYFIIPNTEISQVESFFDRHHSKLSSITIPENRIEINNVGYSNQDIEYSFNLEIINKRYEENSDIRFYITDIKKEKPALILNPAIILENSSNSIFTIYIDGNELY